MKKVLTSVVFTLTFAMTLSTVSSAAIKLDDYDSGYDESSNGYDSGYDGSDDSYYDNYDDIYDGTYDYSYDEYIPDAVDPADQISDNADTAGSSGNTNISELPKPGTINHIIEYDTYDYEYTPRKISNPRKAELDFLLALFPEEIQITFPDFVLSPMVIFSHVISITDKAVPLEDETISLTFSGMTEQMKKGDIKDKTSDKTGTDTDDRQKKEEKSEEFKIIGARIMELPDGSYVLLILKSVKEKKAEPVYAELYGVSDNTLELRDREKVYKDISKQKTMMDSYIGYIDDRYCLFVEEDSLAIKKIYNVFEITDYDIKPLQKQVDKLPDKVVSNL